MKTTHIYWFAYFDFQEPSVRYRAKYPLEKLKEQHGITYNLIIPSYRPAAMLLFTRAFFSILFNRKSESVIVFEKIRTRRIYATALKVLLKVRTQKTIYDIDDADYIKFPPDTIRHFMSNCEKCTVGSVAMANYVKPLNSNVFLLTSPIVDHDHVKGARNKQFTIGWIGYYNAHRESLRTLLFPALLKLDMPVTFVIMGITKNAHIDEVLAYFQMHSNITIKMPLEIDWQDESEVYNMIKGFDVGVAPLLGTPVNHAKSAFKLKQYLSCGVPVLGSNVGENTTFLNHGVNGFCCNNVDDYSQYLNHMAAMSDSDYADLSANALKGKVSFSMDHYCNSLMECLDYHV